MGNPALPDKDIMCHRTGFEKSCFECVTQHGCQLWIAIAGTNPNTGEPINKSVCADAIMPFLTIETAQQSRQAGAAVESFRNEFVRANGMMLALEDLKARPVKGPSANAEIHCAVNKVA